MATTQEDISQWFDNGVVLKASHMFIVCDTFSYEDYPIYIAPEEDVKKRYQNYISGKHEMQKVMEVYSLLMDKETQLKEYRSFNF